jgi:hypothetical protein
MVATKYLRGERTEKKKNDEKITSICYQSRDGRKKQGAVKALPTSFPPNSASCMF